MSANRNLHAAKDKKDDEFYTQRTDIEAELHHYREHFKGKTVYCNCDDPEASEFVKYFKRNFKRLGLKRLITTCYRNKNADLFSRHDSEQAVWLEYKDGESAVRPLNSNGSFRSAECVDLLKRAEIVVTNPPFSKFRDYVAQLMEHGKKFLIIGNMNAITYKEIFPLIKDGQVWLGNTPKGKDMLFDVPEHNKADLVATTKEGSAWVRVDGEVMRRLGNACWYTNLDFPKRHEDLDLSFRYDVEGPERYPRYDNYDAIEVSRVVEIPEDWPGPMGVPISFLDKHNPEQFEILGLAAGNIRGLAGIPTTSGKDGPYINGKLKYGRIFVRNLHPEE